MTTTAAVAAPRDTRPRDDHDGLIPTPDPTPTVDADTAVDDHGTVAALPDRGRVTRRIPAWLPRTIASSAASVAVVVFYLGLLDGLSPLQANPQSVIGWTLLAVAVVVTAWNLLVVRKRAVYEAWAETQASVQWFRDMRARTAATDIDWQPRTSCDRCSGVARHLNVAPPTPPTVVFGTYADGWTAGYTAAQAATRTALSD